jgi:hypothetical protein
MFLVEYMIGFENILRLYNYLIILLSNLTLKKTLIITQICKVLFVKPARVSISLVVRY